MMDETVLNRFWQLLGWILALTSEAFKQINTLPHGLIVAIIAVLALSYWLRDCLKLLLKASLFKS